MAKVMAFGSFDIIHPGHIHFLQEAKSYGDCLVVVLARDSTIFNVKGKKPKYSQHERLTHIRELSFVDKVILGSEGDKYRAIEDEKPDYICLGYDQEAFTDKLENELQKRGIKTKIIRLRPYRDDIYKSSKFR